MSQNGLLIRMKLSTRGQSLSNDHVLEDAKRFAALRGEYEACLVLLTDRRTHLRRLGIAELGDHRIAELEALARSCESKVQCLEADYSVRY